jgi:hypothetical protein
LASARWGPKSWIVLAGVVGAVLAVMVVGVAHSGCVDSRDARLRAGLVHCREAFHSRTGILTDPNGNVSNVRELVAAVREREACEDGVAASVQRPAPNGSSAPAPPLRVDVVGASETPKPSASGTTLDGSTTAGPGGSSAAPSDASADGGLVRRHP